MKLLMVLQILLVRIENSKENMYIGYDVRV